MSLFQLGDKNILSSDGMSFEPLFLTATGGAGAGVIVNCLHGRQLQASLRCIGFDGKFIHLGRLAVQEKSTIGMKNFLKSMTVSTINPQFISTMSETDKQKMHKLIEEGIKSGAVKPLPRSVVEHQHMPKILRYVSRHCQFALTMVFILVSWQKKLRLEK